MKAVLILCFILQSFCTSAQPGAPKTYLLASFEMKFDKTNRQYYYVLEPQRGIDSASEVYTLLKYNNKADAVNDKAAFFYNDKNRSSSLYNYFTTATEGLNYMSSRGWSVISVYQDIASGSENKLSGNGIVPVAAVSAKPVFVFKKE